MIKFKTALRPNKRAENLLAPRLQGQRISLKPPSIEDFDLWKEVREKNRFFLKPYEPEWSKDSLTQDFFLRRLDRQNTERKEGRGAYFLIHRDHKIIGGINLNNIQMGAARHASLGYWLDQDYQGQGYMNEAAHVVIDYAFNVLKLKRLNAACLPDNERSINMLLKLGFEEEGYAKNYLQINGQWQDHRLFGLINKN